MKNRDLLCATVFVLLNFLMYRGIEWLVWIFLVPLIILSIYCSLRETLVFGSIAIALTGYIWLWWLSFHSIQLFALALLTFYLFFISLVALFMGVSRLSLARSIVAAIATYAVTSLVLAPIYAALLRLG